MAVRREEENNETVELGSVCRSLTAVGDGETLSEREDEDCQLLLLGDRRRPLRLWDKRIRAGHVLQVVDQELKCSVLEIASMKSSRTYITCPADPRRVLGVTAPFLHLTVKNLQRSFAIDVLIRDDENVDRRFRARTKQKETQLKPFVCNMPLTLQSGWNQLLLPLREYTLKAYGTTYVQTLRVQMHATCRLQKVYFSHTPHH